MFLLIKGEEDMSFAPHCFERKKKTDDRSSVLVLKKIAHAPHHLKP
jgi:hypothetical protein